MKVKKSITFESVEGHEICIPELHIPDRLGSPDKTFPLLLEHGLTLEGLSLIELLAKRPGLRIEDIMHEHYKCANTRKDHSYFAARIRNVIQDFVKKGPPLTGRHHHKKKPSGLYLNEKGTRLYKQLTGMSLKVIPDIYDHAPLYYTLLKVCKGARKLTIKSIVSSFDERGLTWEITGVESTIKRYLKHYKDSFVVEQSEASMITVCGITELGESHLKELKAFNKKISSYGLQFASL